MIIGERVRLRAVEKQDLPLYVKWLNDPEVTKGLTLYLPLSLAQEEKWFENMLAMPKDEQPMAIEVSLKDEWQIIGNCGFHNIDWRCHCAEVGIFIGDKAMWNQGFGSEAMDLLLRHGFNTLNLNRIGLVVYANNPRAIRSYEKVGFLVEGRKRQAIYKDGQYIDEILMSVIREDWLNRQVK